ncbi:hypothetical protein GCM10010465_11850 [Actinomadura fibrosa]
MTSSLTCVTSQTAEATANITITDDASISAPGNKDQSGLCLNSAIDPITFSIEGSGNGATVTGLPPGVSGSYSSGNFTISGASTSSGSFTYTVTATGPCGSATESGTLTVLKDATINLSSGNNSQDVCQDEAIANITYDIGETGTEASVTGLPSGISGNFSGGVYTISGSSSLVGSFPYTITATGTCGNSESLNGTIIISENLEPSVSISSSDTDNNICAGTEVTFTATPVNGGSNPSYQWQIDGSNAGTDSPTFTTNSLTDGQIVTVIMISDATCLSQPSATSNEITTTVNPNLTPQVTVSPSDSDICDGDSITFTAEPTNGGTAPSYQWKLDGNNVGTNSPTFTTSNLSAGQNVTVVLTSNETCLSTTTATSDPVSVTVNPNLTPEVSITSNDSNNIICAGSSITFTATSVNEGANPSYQWYVDGNPEGSGGASFTTSSLSNGQTVKVIMTSDEECLAVPTAESNEISIQVDSSVIGITPAFDTSDPTINSTAVCPVVSGLKYRVQDIPGATSYNWTFPSGWNITNGAGTNEVTVTATASAQTGPISVTATNECGNSNTFTSDEITTGTVVYVNAGPDQTVCKGTTQITLAGEIGGVITKHQDWDWSASVSGGSFSNGGNSLNGTYTLPSSIANSGGTIIIKITSIDPAGPCDPKEDEMIITVLKNATISTPSNKDQTVCVNTPISNIAFTITDAGTGATVTGLPAGLNGNYNSGIFTISGTPTESGNFTYTVNSTGNCSTQQTAITGTITVNEDQKFTNDPTNKSQEICINTAIDDITFTTNTTVTNVSVTGLPAGLTGNYSAGNFVISGTATEAGSFDYVLTTSGDCVSTTQNGNITVKPDPTIDTPVNMDQELCINTAIADIQFNLTSPATDAEVNGLPEGVNGSFNNSVFTISGTPTEAGTFDYTVTSISDCEEVSRSGQIIVKPDPTAEIQYPNDLCESQIGNVTVTLTGTGAYEGGNYYSSPEGLSLNTDTGEITPGASTPGTYTVFYDTPEGCKTATATTTVIINELPSVDISYTGPFCNSDATEYSVSFANGIGAYTGGTFSSTPGGLDIDPTTGSINPKTSSPSTNPYTVFYTIPASLGCDPVTVQTEVTITQLPQVSINYTTPLCTADPNSYTVNYSSIAGDYLGGEFTATEGLVIDSEGTIDPANSTPGIHTITYTKDNNADGCEAVQVTTQVEIFEKVQITTQPVNYGTCSSNPASFEVIATGDNLTYQWYKKDSGGNFVQINGETNSILSFNNATSANAGEYQVVVSSTNPVCASETSNIVTLNIDEDIIITKPVEDITICEDDYQSLTFEYEANAKGAPLTFQWIKDGNPIYPSQGKYVMTETGPTGADGVYSGKLTIENININDDGVYAVEIDGPDYFTCAAATSKTFTFRVNPRPGAPETSPVEYCLGETPEPLTAIKDSEDNELLWYSYDDTAQEYVLLGNSYTPTTDTPGTFSYWVTQKQPNECESDPEELIVTIYDKPDPVAAETIEFKYCYNETVSNPLSVDPIEGATINWYDAVDATTVLGSAPVPNTSEVKVTSYWVSQTLTSTGCESERTKVDITINPLPEIDISIASGYSSEICLNTETRLIASGATTYIWSLDGNDVGTGNELTVTGDSVGTFEYSVTGTDDNGCVNTDVISIYVEEPSDGGVTSGPASVCITQNYGTITLTGKNGEIQRWESSTDGSNWTSIAQTSETLDFQDLPSTTIFRAVVKNGVCDEAYSTELSIDVDPEPVAGQILFNGNDRVFTMCEFPTEDYVVPLQTVGSYVGEIVSWQYRRNSDTEWRTVLDGSAPYTGNTLEGSQVMAASSNESTLFRVEVQSGACSPNVYSEYATLSVIPSDIAPSPVSVLPPEICFGDYVTLSSSTGYGGYGTFLGGAFDNSSIANHGWRVMRYGEGNDGTEYTFESAADNTRPDRWMRTTPKEFEMANTSTGSGIIDQLFDSCSCDEGNKGFAIVSGNNPSTLETPIFNLYATDDPVLTFDQAYNLTDGDIIRVEISLDGGQTYTEAPLMEIIGPEHSDNYEKFGDDGLGEPNNMAIDLSKYAGLGNLRIRWLYDGTTGGIYTIDDIGLPEDPQNVQLVWYYDDDLNDPNNPLVQIGEVNQSVVQYTPEKIGWNYFEVQTALVFDTNGDPCESVENKALAQVYVFDTYSTTATANVGSCGSSEVPLSGTLTGGQQGEITEFPLDDQSTVAWTVISGPDGYTFSEDHFATTGTGPAIEDPNATFTPPIEGEYTLSWTITPDERNTCPVNNGEVTFYFADCTTLDFDGDDDYIDLGNNYNGSYFIETWIRPFDRPLEDESGTTDASTGVIFSSSGFELKMENLPAEIKKNTRWYHIAVSNNGDLWVDGIPSGKIVTTGSGINNTSIGARYNASTKTTSNHFSGWIEELRIWNKVLTDEQIRFMMNQRLKLDASGTVVTPLQGEVVPNLAIQDGGLSSYHTDGTYNLDQNDLPFYNLSTSDLAGYYRLISKNPDPAGLISFDVGLMPSNGFTPDHSSSKNSKVPGRLYNITTNQENTSPTPYFSGNDGDWELVNTWARPNVWDFPNSTGVNGDPIDWNIARTSHNITSGDKNITMLGLHSESGLLTIEADHPIRITHYLKLDGNIDLVGESQLLQDHGSILDNTSAGWLERDQQGTQRSFNYNYWSSPVAIQGANNNSGYTVGDILKNPNGTIDFIDNPYAADPTGLNPTNIIVSSYWLWTYFPDAADIYANWDYVGSDGALNAAEGFTMKGTSGAAAISDRQNYAFKGKPNNGDILSSTMGTNQNYLVGNPYPSAIDSQKFMDENQGKFNGALYFWSHFAGQTHVLEQYIGGYAVRNYLDGIEAVSTDWRIDDSGNTDNKIPGQFIPVAQGFFLNTVPILSTDPQTYGTVQFRNTQRVYEIEGGSTSIFFSQERKRAELKKTQETGFKKIWLKFRSPIGYHRQILVGAVPQAGDGFDWGYDAPLIEDNAEDMYWYFIDQKFVIQAVSDFNPERELQMGVKIQKPGTLTIELDKLENIPADMNIFIKDSLHQIVHNLRDGPYETTSEEGTFTNRFKLAFQDDTVIEPEPEPELEEGPFEVLYITGTREILIRNPQLIGVDKVYLNNALGQQVHMYYDIPVEKEIRLPVNRFASGMYIVKVHSEEGIVTKKVILE